MRDEFTNASLKIGMDGCCKRCNIDGSKAIRVDTPLINANVGTENSCFNLITIDKQYHTFATLSSYKPLANGKIL